MACPVDVSVIRQFIPTYPTVLDIVVIAQNWPCWLSSALAVRLPVIGAFFASRLHQCFEVPPSLEIMTTWSTLAGLADLRGRPANYVMLASGSMSFFHTLQRTLTLEGPLIFSVDMPLPHQDLRDTLRLYRSWATHRAREAFASAIL